MYYNIEPLVYIEDNLLDIYCNIHISDFNKAVFYFLFLLLKSVETYWTCFGVIL